MFAANVLPLSFESEAMMGGETHSEQPVVARLPFYRFCIRVFVLM
jgi:hypothetical protein